MTTSIEIERPVAEVFAFFKDSRTSRAIIGSVRSVLDYQDGRSHWELYTPSGAVVEWDAVVTKYVPNSVIAWESVVRSLVDSSGMVRLRRVSSARTRVDHRRSRIAQFRRRKGRCADAPARARRVRSRSIDISIDPAFLHRVVARSAPGGDEDLLGRG